MAYIPLSERTKKKKKKDEVVETTGQKTKTTKRTGYIPLSERESFTPEPSKFREGIQTSREVSKLYRSAKREKRLGKVKDRIQEAVDKLDSFKSGETDEELASRNEVLRAPTAKERKKFKFDRPVDTSKSIEKADKALSKLKKKEARLEGKVERKKLKEFYGGKTSVGSFLDSLKSGTIGTKSYLQTTTGSALENIGFKQAGAGIMEQGRAKQAEKQAFDAEYRKYLSAEGAQEIRPETLVEMVRSGNGRYLANLVAESLPGVAVTGVVGAPLALAGAPVAATGAAVLSGAAISYGATYQDIENYEAETGEVIPKGKKEKIALATALATAPLEALGEFRIFKKIAGPATALRFKNSLAGNLMRGFLSSGKQAGIESSTEVLQTITENAIATTYDENRELYEGVKEAGLVGGVTGGMIDVMVSTMSLAKRALPKIESDIKQQIKEDQDLAGPEQDFGAEVSAIADQVRGTTLEGEIIEPTQEDVDLAAEDTADIETALEAMQKEETEVEPDEALFQRKEAAESEAKVPKPFKKFKDFETEEGNFTQYAIDGDPKSGVITVHRGKDGFTVRNILLPKDQRGKGIGTQAYRAINAQSLKETGKPLMSTKPRTLESGFTIHELSSDGRGLWDSFVKKGEAVKNSDGTYQFKRKEAARDRTQMVIHNISASKLRKAGRLGGLASPSVAVVDVEKGTLEGFGEITLVAPKSMVDTGTKRDLRTYGADVYSPRFPRAEYTADYADRTALSDYFKSVSEKFGGNEHDARIETHGDVHRSLSGSMVAQIDFLEKKGVEFEVVKDKGGSVDSPKTRDNLRNVIRDNRLQEEFENYVEDTLDDFKFEGEFFEGFTPSGRRKTKKLTLENAVKIMSKTDRGSEGFYYGLGNVRAMLTPELKGIEKLKEAKDRIVTSEQFEIVKKEMSDRFDELAEKLRSYYIYPDALHESVGELVAGQRGAKELFKDVPTKLMKEVDELREDLKFMPTEYFEGKFKRSVGVGEFATALVPEDASDITISHLEEQGVQVVKYSDQKDRLEKLRRISKEREDIAFKKKEGQPIKRVSAKAGVEKIRSYEKRLGVKVPVFVADKIYTGEAVTPEAYGMYFDGAITLARVIEEFTADHEFGHFVFRNMEDIPAFKGQSRAEIFKQLRKEYGLLSDTALEEKLMVQFEKYLAQKAANKPTTIKGKIKAFFDSMYKMLTDMLGITKTEYNSIQKFYDTMYFGKASMQNKGVITFQDTGKTSQFMKDRAAEFGEPTPAFQRIEGEQEFMPEDQATQLAAKQDYREDLQEKIIEAIPDASEEFANEMHMMEVRLEGMKEDLDSDSLRFMNRFKITRGEMKGTFPEEVYIKRKNQAQEKLIADFKEETGKKKRKRISKEEMLIAIENQYGTWEEARKQYPKYEQAKRRYEGLNTSYKDMKIEARSSKQVEKMGIKAEKLRKKMILADISEKNRKRILINKGIRIGTKVSMLLQKQAIDAMRTSIPVSRRGKYTLRISKIGTSQSRLMKILDSIAEEKEQLDITAGARAEVARMRSRIGLIKKTWDINNSVILDIKRKLDIREVYQSGDKKGLPKDKLKSINKMTLQELEMVVAEIRERIRWSEDNKYSYFTYSEPAEKTKGVWNKFKKGIKAFDTELVAPIERTIKNMSNSLYHQVMDVFFEIDTDVTRYSKMITPFVEIIDKTTDSDRAALKMYISNSSMDKVQMVLEQYASPEEVKTALDQVREVLDELHTDLKSVDIDLGYLENYFPRKFVELDRDVAQSLLANAARKLERPLTQQEREAVLDKMVRGVNIADMNIVTLSGKKFEAERMIDEITPEIAQYYEDPIVALTAYINGAKTVVAQRKFFGKAQRDGLDLDKSMENSIQAKVLELYDAGVIDSKDIEQLKESLYLLFQHRVGKIGKAVLSFSSNYIVPMLLWKGTNAFRQFKDIIMQWLLNDAFAGQVNTSIRNLKIKPEDIGQNEDIVRIESGIDEDKKNKLAKAFDKAMFFFKGMDRGAFTVFLNAANSRLIKTAQSKNKRKRDRLLGDLIDMFGETEANKFFAEIQKMDVNNLPDELNPMISRWLYTEAARIRPITKAQKTKFFVRHPVYGILRSFMMKQIEFIRSEGIDYVVRGAKTGDKRLVVEGIGRLTAMLAAIALIGGSVEQAIDWMLGKVERETFFERMFENLLQIIGFNNYMFSIGKQRGMALTTTYSYLPAPYSAGAQIVDTVYGDIKSLIEGDPKWKTLKYVPLGGDVLYYRAGPGSQ